MPFYEYECASCKFYTEVLQKITDEPLRKCPSCGKHQLKKLVSAPVFRLKGSGWYETDFKSDKEHKRNLAVDKEPESASGSGDKSGDGKTSDSKSSGSKPASVTPSRSTRRAAARRASPAVAAKAKRPAAKAKSKAKSAARRKGR